MRTPTPASLAPAVCKLFPHVTRRPHLTRRFFPSLTPYSPSVALPFHRVWNLYCPHLSRPIHVNCSECAGNMRKSAKASGAPGVSGDCLCSARLSLPRLPGALPSQGIFSWPQDRTSKNMSQDWALWHSVSLTLPALVSLCRVLDSVLLVEQIALRSGSFAPGAQDPGAQTK